MSEAEQQLREQVVRAEKAENALSALREAVGRYLKAHDAVDKTSMGTRHETAALEEYDGAFEVLCAAHDAAPAAPTLTLEEVDKALGRVLDEMLPRHFPAARRRQILARFRDEIAQKGAGRER